MRFKLVEKRNPQAPAAPKKIYAVPFSLGRVNEAFLSGIISERASLTEGDVASVVRNFLDEIPRWLRMGHSVHLEPLGSFRLSFGSEGADTEEEFQVGMIRNLKVLFTPGVRFKEMLKRTEFRKIDVNK